MEEDGVTINWENYIKEEVSVNDLFKNLKNDKINRTFLCNHVGEIIEIWGYFDRIVPGSRALMQNCGFFEFGMNFNLGHMRWDDFLLHKPKGKIYKYGEFIRIKGLIYEYKNTDPDFDPEYTYGVRVIEFL